MYDCHHHEVQQELIETLMKKATRSIDFSILNNIM